MPNPPEGPVFADFIERGAYEQAAAVLAAGWIDPGRPAATPALLIVPDPGQGD